MMYSPEHYKEASHELALEIVNKYSFATVITNQPDGPFVSHLPFLLEVNGEKKYLIGHCAKANPQWKHFSKGQNPTLIFQGPHSYISPAWYQPKPDNVPTWNYIAVHIRGPATIVTNSNETYDILKKITQKYENEYQTGWELPEVYNSDLGDLLNAIVAFKIDIQNIQAKFKLSQNLEERDRENVIHKLSEIKSESNDLASYMKVIKRW